MPMLTPWPVRSRFQAPCTRASRPGTIWLTRCHWPASPVRGVLRLKYGSLGTKARFWYFDCPLRCTLRTRGSPRGPASFSRLACRLSDATKTYASSSLLSCFLIRSPWSRAYWRGSLPGLRNTRISLVSASWPSLLFSTSGGAGGAGNWAEAVAAVRANSTVRVGVRGCMSAAP